MDSCGIKHRRQILEWRERIAACRGSGLNVKTWCQQEGFSIKTYYRWEHEVLRMASELLIPKEAPVQIGSGAIEPVFEELPAPVTQMPADTPQIVAAVYVGRNRLEVYSGASTEIVSALCEALKNAK